MKFRIVYNSYSERYRIEKRNLMGWNFVIDRETGQYLNFDDEEKAREWVRAQPHSKLGETRRWKVVSEC
ncbi:MAG: hypothetical protein ACPGU7_06815 [Gammaproteobacteria bacterium]